MTIKESQNKRYHFFYVGNEQSPLAQMVFQLPEPGLMIVEHTEVDESLSGKGVGKQLVAFAVNYARTHQLKIRPYCPFTHAVISKTKEYQDVWDKTSEK